MKRLAGLISLVLTWTTYVIHVQATIGLEKAETAMNASGYGFPAICRLFLKASEMHVFLGLAVIGTGILVAIQIRAAGTEWQGMLLAYNTAIAVALGVSLMITLQPFLAIVNTF